MTGARAGARDAPLEDAPLEVAILVFDGVEVLDFAGPFEVFSVASELAAEAGGGEENEEENRHGEPFRVRTPSPGAASIRAAGGLEVVPSHRLEDCPGPDLLIVPGGVGVRALLGDERVLGWVRGVAHDDGARVVASVCTGALLLAQAGLLDGREAVTHHRHLDELEALARRRGTTVRARGDVRFLDLGPVATAGGIAAGIDLALHLVERFRGPSLAARTAAYMELPWRGREGWRREAAPVAVAPPSATPSP